MAEDLIKVKDLPIISNYEDVLPDDRVVTTHLSGSTRETVAVTIDALGRKVEADAPNSAAVPRNLFGYENPSASDGRNNDLYFKLMNGATGIVVIASYIKINGQWISFQVTDDNWRRFLEGQGFDVISYDATSVKAHAFENNTQINNVIMPNVTHVYEYAFKGSSLKSMTLPSCVFIGENAFENCEVYLDGTHIDLPNVETIGANAFSLFGNADHKSTINISNIKNVGNRAFYHPYFWRDRDAIITFEKCETIGEQAFAAYGDSYPHLFVKILNLPSIVSIGEQAFRAIDAPDDFELHIGPNCKTIGPNILYTPDIRNNKGSIYVEAITPPTLVDGFSMSMGSPEWYPAHIYVPYQSVQAYKEASKWSMYASLIEAIPEVE